MGKRRNFHPICRSCLPSKSFLCGSQICPSLGIFREWSHNCKLSFQLQKSHRVGPPTSLSFVDALIKHCPLHSKHIQGNAKRASSRYIRPGNMAPVGPKLPCQNYPPRIMLTLMRNESCSSAAQDPSGHELVICRSPYARRVRKVQRIHHANYRSSGSDPRTHPSPFARHEDLKQSKPPFCRPSPLCRGYDRSHGRPPPPESHGELSHQCRKRQIPQVCQDKQKCSPGPKGTLAS